MKAKHVEAVGGRSAVSLRGCRIQFSRTQLPVEQLQESQQYDRAGLNAAEAPITLPASSGRALRSGVRASARLEKVTASSEQE